MLQTRQNPQSGYAQTVGQVTAKSPEAPTEIGHVLTRCTDNNHSLYSAVGRLDAAVARLTGASVGELLNDASNKSTLAPGMLGMVREQVSVTAQLIDKLDAIVARLSEIV